MKQKQRINNTSRKNSKRSRRKAIYVPKVSLLQKKNAEILKKTKDIAKAYTFLNVQNKSKHHNKISVNFEQLNPFSMFLKKPNKKSHLKSLRFSLNKQL